MARRWVVRAAAAVVAVVLVSLTVPVIALSPIPPFSVVGPRISGMTAFVAGEWIAQDFVYDDGEQVDNAADIVELRVRVDRRDLVMRVVFNTLRPTDATVLGVALGTPTSAARAWPTDSAVSSPWDRFVTIAPVARTATVTAADGSSTALPTPFVDLEYNTVDFRLPGAGARSGVLVINAGAGAGGSSTVDLAFNSRDDEADSSDFRNDAQQAAIESGDVSAMSREIDLARLTSGATDPPTTATGFYNAVFKSRQAVAEGYDTENFPKYRGLYQPYALWLPPGLDPRKPTPLVLVLHSLGQTHNQYGRDVYPQVAGAIGAIAITPLAMGEDGWYWDEALVDTLDAWADVRRRYSIDRERTFSSGYSMGGYGTYRLATLVPELIAAGISWVGPPTDGIWTGTDLTASNRTPGLTFTQIENTYNVPFFIVHGTNDELVPVQGPTRVSERMYELGHEYRYNLHPGQDHFSFAIIDDWTREAQWIQGRSRETRPSRVAFKYRPATWSNREEPVADPVIEAHVDALLTELGDAERDSAYWVRDVVPAGLGTGDVTGFVDLTSQAITERVPVTQDASGVGVMGSSPHVVRALDRYFAIAAPENALTGALTGVSEVTIDVRRAGLLIDGLRVDVTSDTPAVIHLVDGTRRVDVSVGGP